MRILLDTHVVIWWDEGKRLSRDAERAIRSADAVFVSAASGWEIATKVKLGKLKPRRSVVDAIAASGFEELPVRLTHAEELATLPLHHRDPFDRMLVAQAIAEGLTIVTRDASFDDYDVKVIAA